MNFVFIEHYSLESAIDLHSQKMIKKIFSKVPLRWNIYTILMDNFLSFLNKIVQVIKNTSLCKKYTIRILDIVLFYVDRSLYRIGISR